MAGLRAIDHIVLAVRALDQAAARYAALGFTLTPRASHPDHMGTANRLAQFADRSFIEMLEVDRPQSMAPHDAEAVPPFFGFGAHNKEFLARREGMSMLVFTGQDQAADVAGFSAAGLGGYAPFDFGRKAVLPNGSEVEVAFSLAFATLPGAPGPAFFTCHNRFPENFWKPGFQRHANGASGIAAAYLALAEPAPHRAHLQALTGAEAERVEGGLALRLANDQVLYALTPDAIAAASGFPVSEAPGLTGIALKGPNRERIGPRDAFGMFII
ncbi:MAG: VOC family protein [Pseudomonadota bacterium]